MFNFNGGARADLMAAVEELERHNDQERHIDMSHRPNYFRRCTWVPYSLQSRYTGIG